MNSETYNKFQTIIGHLVAKRDNKESLTGINISNLFKPDEDIDETVARNINAAFLICLSGDAHPKYHEAEEYLSEIKQHPSLREIASFYLKGLSLIQREIENFCSDGSLHERKLNELYSWIVNESSSSQQSDNLEKLHSFFFPEGKSILSRTSEMIDALRDKRTIILKKLNPYPVRNLAEEILFTSNILLTTPPKSKN
ncbi:unnamed protein product, partial [marine sediment metagenome]